MTSSLVGSEMCIRDRVMVVLGPLNGRRNEEDSSLAMVGCLMMLCKNLIAVSYTHLTLPTICSV
eukprot:4825626-Prorocentrum_lima.AAC.1